LFALLLYLFPKTYREEYGEELRAVFDLSLDDAIKTGTFGFAYVALSEFLSMPKAIIHEHLREKRKQKMPKKFNSYFDFAHGTPREFFVAIVPFLIVGIIHPIMNVLMMSGLLVPRSLFVNGIGILLVAVLGILFLLGLAAGLPRWAMPYLGFASAVLGVITYPDILRLFQREFPFLYQRLRSVGDFFYANAWNLWLFVVVIVFMILAGNLSAFRRFRADWTLLCFISYGAAPLALLLTFEEYRNDEPFMFLAFMVLAFGAWIYLQGRNEWKRFTALFGALTLAMFIAAAGKAILLPVQDWPIVIDPASWKSEAMGTVNTWMWLAVIMLIPLALKLFPRAEEQLQTA
jgi:hypothetical protein